MEPLKAGARGEGHNFLPERQDAGGNLPREVELLGPQSSKKSWLPGNAFFLLNQRAFVSFESPGLFEDDRQKGFTGCWRLAYSVPGLKRPMKPYIYILCILSINFPLLQSGFP